RHRAPSSPAAGHTRPSATDPRNRMTGAGAARVPRRGSARPRASAPALQFFCDQVLHRRVVQRQLGVHALEAAVLGLQLLDPLQVRGVHAAVLRLPLVVRRRADPGLPAQVLDRNPGITLLEDRDDLGLAELRLLHGTSWLRRCQKALLLGCPGLGEAYERASALSLVLLSTKAMSSTESSLRSATTRVNASGASVNIASANSAEVGMRQPSGNSEIGEAASNPALTSIDDISMMANA